MQFPLPPSQSTDSGMQDRTLVNKRARLYAKVSMMVPHDSHFKTLDGNRRW